jgi:hypothetical protein
MLEWFADRNGCVYGYENSYITQHLVWIAVNDSLLNNTPFSLEFLVPDLYSSEMNST